MIAGWSTVRFGDVAHVKHGFAFSGMAPDSDSSRPVVVGIGNFDYAGGFRFGSTTIKRYLGDIPKEFALSPGDLLLAMTCQTADGEILGIPGRVPDDGTTYLHNQRLGKVEPLDPNRFDLGFAFQLARWKPFNHHLFVTASGSKILHTSPGRIEEFSFELPPIEEQRAIAATLGALDDKIDSNLRMVELGNQWLDSSSEAAAATLPLVALSSLVDASRTTIDPTGLGDLQVDHFSLPAFDNGVWPERVDAESIKSNKLLIDRPSILVSRLNPRFNRTWWAEPDDGVVSLSSTEFTGLTASSPVVLAGAWLAVRAPYFREELARRVTGTSGSHQRIRPDDLLTIDVPDTRQLPKATLECALALLDLIHVRRREIGEIVTLRNVLLPELLTGRMRESVARDVVEELTA